MTEEEFLKHFPWANDPEQPKAIPEEQPIAKASTRRKERLNKNKAIIQLLQRSSGWFRL